MRMVMAADKCYSRLDMAGTLAGSTSVITVALASLHTSTACCAESHILHLISNYNYVSLISKVKTSYIPIFKKL
uniref:Secreted protein n=1 Tax=Heterorhabditis bacteriophora TaxID=37862 RepID=A0A1I7W9D6_HETBA